MCMLYIPGNACVFLDPITLSKLYLQDMPEESVVVLQYPISYDQYKGTEEILFNSTKWKFNDQCSIQNIGYILLETCYRMLVGFGSDLNTCVPCIPNERLVQHWEDKLGIVTRPNYVHVGELDVPHAVLFPLECLDRHLHAVDPDMLYKINSKMMIQEIDCPQAEVLNQPTMPCVIKVTHSGFGEANFCFHNIEHFHAKKRELDTLCPRPEYVVTRLIENVAHEYTPHFYIRKSGEIQWLGVVESLTLEQSGLAEDGDVKIVRMEPQENLEQLLRPAMIPISERLHQEGYFGIVGVDMLMDMDGKQFVLDINPRINDGTALMLCARIMSSKGYTAGVSAGGIKAWMSEDDIFAQSDKEDKGIIVIISILNKEKFSLCQMFIFSNSIEECWQILHRNFPGNKASQV